MSTATLIDGRGKEYSEQARAFWCFFPQSSIPGAFPYLGFAPTPLEPGDFLECAEVLQAAKRRNIAPVCGAPEVLELGDISDAISQQEYPDFDSSARAAGQGFSASATPIVGRAKHKPITVGDFGPVATQRVC